MLKNWFRDEFGRDCTQEELYAQLIKRTYDIGLDRRVAGNGCLYLGLDTEIDLSDIIDKLKK